MNNDLSEYGVTSEETGEVTKIHLTWEDSIIECEKVCVIFGLYEDTDETYIRLEKMDKEAGNKEINLRKNFSSYKCHDIEKETFFKNLDIVSSEAHIDFTKGQRMDCEIERCLELLDNIPEYEKSYKSVGIWYNATGVKNCF